MNLHTDFELSEKDIEDYISKFNDPRNSHSVMEFQLDEFRSVIVCSLVGFHTDEIEDYDFTVLTPVWIKDPYALFTQNGKYELELNKSICFNHNLPHAGIVSSISFEDSKKLNIYRNSIDQNFKDQLFLNNSSALLVATVTVHKESKQPFCK